MPNLIPLIWLTAVGPGTICAWMLFGPALRLRIFPPRRAAARA
jgi:hypothetical protein